MLRRSPNDLSILVEQHQRRLGGLPRFAGLRHRKFRYSKDRSALAGFIAKCECGSAIHAHPTGSTRVAKRKARNIIAASK
jgi:hypothetical protein